MLLILFRVSPSRSQEIGIGFISLESDSISTEIEIADSLSSRLDDYIHKGIPAGFEYRAELWRVRRGWFDKQIGAVDVEYRARYDTWSKRYTIVNVRPEYAAEYTLERKREFLDLVSSTGAVAFPADDSSAEYYIVAKLTIRIMTLSNLEEVESWLKGEISEMDKPSIKRAPDRFGDFLFNTALKITGLQNVSKEIRTDGFHLADLPLRFGN